MVIKVDHSSFKLAAFILILCLEDINTSYVRDSGKRDNRNDLSIINQREHVRNYSEKHNSDRLFPITKSQYVYKNHQTGSAYAPWGGKVQVSPDPNKTMSYTAQIETTIYSPKKHLNRRSHNHYARHTDFNKRVGYASYKESSHGICLQCPAEKTVIAQKGVDGALIEMPRLLNCKNQVISPTHYEIQTLFSPKFNFVLPQSNGIHSFMGKIVNKKTNRVVQSCILKYKVIVRQCGKYYPTNKELKTYCDLGSIWGSTCRFHCRNGGDLDDENAAVTCDDDLTWEGVEPTCLYNSISDDYAYENDASYSTTSCELPIPPDHGKFSCDIKNTENTENDLNVPNGTLCRIKCNKHFDMPQRLQPHSLFNCQNGRWNSTMTHFCQKQRRKRHNYAN